MLPETDRISHLADSGWGGHTYGPRNAHAIGGHGP